MRRPSFSLLGIHNVSVTLEYAMVTLLAREALLAANAPSYQYALLVILPVLMAAVSTRYLCTLSGNSWRMATLRSTAVCFGGFALAAIGQTPLAWLVAMALLPVGQVIISGQYRLILSNHHEDPSYIHRVNAVTRSMAGLGRLASFLVIISLPLVWKDHLLGLILMALMRSLAAVTFFLFARHEPAPTSLTAGTPAFSLPRVKWTPDALAGVLSLALVGAFGAIEVDFFTTYAGAEHYAYSRAGQYLAIAVAGSALFLSPIVRVVGTARGVLLATAVSAFGMAVSSALTGCGWITLAVVASLISGVATLALAGSDILLSLTKGGRRKETVNAILLYRYIACIAGAMMGPVLLHLLGPRIGSLVAGILFLVLVAYVWRREPAISEVEADPIPARA